MIQYWNEPLWKKEKKIYTFEFKFYRTFKMKTLPQKHRSVFAWNETCMIVECLQRDRDHCICLYMACVWLCVWVLVSRSIRRPIIGMYAISIININIIIDAMQRRSSSRIAQVKRPGATISPYTHTKHNIYMHIHTHDVQLLDGRRPLLATCSRSLALCVCVCMWRCWVVFAHMFLCVHAQRRRMAFMNNYPLVFILLLPNEMRLYLRLAAYTIINTKTHARNVTTTNCRRRQRVFVCVCMSAQRMSTGSCMIVWPTYIFTRTPSALIARTIIVRTKTRETRCSHVHVVLVDTCIQLWLNTEQLHAHRFAHGKP